MEEQLAICEGVHYLSGGDARNDPVDGMLTEEQIPEDQKQRLLVALRIRSGAVPLVVQLGAPSRERILVGELSGSFPSVGVP